MGNVTRIDIIVEGVYHLDYESPEDLGIKFNRITEDLNDISASWGEFSYSFTLPITKVNREAFTYADVKGRKGVFVNTRKSCRVYNNELLLSGLIELRAIRSGYYECVFFSTFTQLLDQIGDKDLQELESMEKIPNFDYENDIISHLNQNYADSDSTSYQFPFVYYSTAWCPSSILSGAGVDFAGNPFSIPDNYYQNWYYEISSDKQVGEDYNKYYHHQFPMGVYIKPVMESILTDAGWDLGGSFFERDEIKKIIMLYTGDNDAYDRATGIVSGLTTTGITTSSFLPSGMKQTDFMAGIINMFNLYFTLDIDNKIIKFETWETLFGDNYDPYNITEKVFGDSVVFSSVDNYDPSITFQQPDNTRVLGDNKVMSESQDLANNVTYIESEDKYTLNTFNKIGTTSEISLPFGMPLTKRTYLRQDFNDSGTDKDGGDFQVWLPMLTKQTANDNDNKPFYTDDKDSFGHNTEDTITHVGAPTLMYYFGQSESDYEKISGTNNERFYYLPIGTVPTRTSIGFASPWTLVQGNALTTVNNYLDEVDADNRKARTKDAAEASYLKGNVYNLGKIAGDVTGVPDYSLTFGDDDKFGNTLWTKFHKPKYDLYKNSEMLTCTMRMNNVDWREMQINRPIKYNHEIYSILSIENYDVVNNTADLKLIKR